LTNERSGSNGFTLMELLIVMAIIAILMLIAIPTVGSLKKKANDLSAQQSVRAIHEAEIQFQSTYPRTDLRARCPLWAVNLLLELRRRPVRRFCRAT